jgi:hypothetical protein
MNSMVTIRRRPVAPWALVAALWLCGCGKSVDRLQPLSDEEADKYEAPRADGTCLARKEMNSWVNAVEVGVLRVRENLRLALDSCVNAVAVASLHGGGPFIYGVRLFRDGSKDENFFLKLANDIERFGLTIDKYGNVIVISESGLQVVTAAGRMHVGISERGVPLTGDFVFAGPDDTWVVSGQWRGLATLPSGDMLWETPWAMNRVDQRTSVVVWQEATVLYSRVNEPSPFSSRNEEGASVGVYSHSIYGADEDWTFWYGTNDTLESDPTWYADTALLAADDSQKYLGTTSYSVDPDSRVRISCRESMIINIDDPNWKPSELGFCGALEAIELGDDGSLYSLWTVPVETLDAEVHPFEAEATLVRHDAEGTETGRWVLTETFGRLAQDGSGAMDMKLVDGGKGAIIGALVGGPWNGRFFTHPSNVIVARIPLE